MGKEQSELKVTLIGKRELSELDENELMLLVEFYIDEMEKLKSD